MITGLSGRSAFRQAGMLLAFALAVSSMLTGEAQAGCGHYVFSAAQRDRLASLSDLQVVSLIERAEESAPLVPREIPCSGPSCSRTPLSPDAPAPPAPVSSDSWCNTAFPLRLASPEGALGLGLPSAVRPVRRASALLRPPRSARPLAS
jgi:hypothetical protein